MRISDWSSDVCSSDLRKQRAGAVADLMQEIRFLPLCLPVRRDADPTAIGQDETRHVDGVGGGMLAAIPGTASIEAAAAIGPAMRDLPNRPAEMALGDRTSTRLNPST